MAPTTDPGPPMDFDGSNDRRMTYGGLSLNDRLWRIERSLNEQARRIDSVHTRVTYGTGAMGAAAVLLAIADFLMRQAGR